MRYFVKLKRQKLLLLCCHHQTNGEEATLVAFAAPKSDPHPPIKLQSVKVKVARSAIYDRWPGKARRQMDKEKYKLPIYSELRLILDSSIQNI